MACKDREPELSGEWKSSNRTLSVIKEGDEYFIKISNTNYLDGLDLKYSGKYQDGIIKIGQSKTGDITYSKERDLLYFNGEEYSR